MSLATRLDPILEPLMRAVRYAERFLGPEDDWVEEDRRIAYEAAQHHFGHLHTFIREKGKADYVTTVHADSDAVERVLSSEGYDRNLASTRKYRTHHGGGRQWAVGSFATELPARDGLERQHHVYLFEAPSGATDVYAHAETSVVEGAEHLTETRQEQGAAKGLFDIFDRHGLEYGRRETLN
jgi:hypothetical protein